MKPISEFITELAGLDARIWSEDGKLKINAPEGALSPATRSELTARKAEILEFLARSHPTDVDRAIPLFDRSKPIPLTHGQERIWSLARMEPGNSRYNVPLVYELVGNLDIAYLELALNEVTKRHEILRTRFPGEEVTTVRQEVSPTSAVVISVSNNSRELRRLSSEQIEAEIARMLRTEVHHPFDIVAGPLWRVGVFGVSRKKHFLVFTMHHLIFDGLSQPIFLREVSACYKALKKKQAPELPSLALQFADFAGWQRMEAADTIMGRQLDYWMNQLSGEVPGLKLPNDRKRSAAGTKSGSVAFNINGKTSLALLKLCREERSSPYVVLLSAFIVALHSFTEQEDMVICSPAASREHSDLEPLLGYFNSLIVIRTRQVGPETFRELIGRVRRIVLDASDHQLVPIQTLAQLPNLVRTPLTRAMFSFQDSDSREFDLPGVTTMPIDVRKDTPDFELALYSRLRGGLFAGSLDFDSDLFSKDTISDLLDRFSEVLSEASADPGFKIPTIQRPGFLEQARTGMIQHPQIDDAFLITNPKSGGSVAYLVLNEDDVPSLALVHSHATSLLPDWLVPEVYIPVDKFPRLPDGEVDATALPEADRRGSHDETYLAPRTDLEKELAAIWKKVLWLDQDVSVTASFRDLGGHSLLSVQLVAEVEKALGRPMPESVLGNLGTIEAMAAALEGRESERPRNDAANQMTGSALPPEIYRGLRSYTASWDGIRKNPDSVIVGLNVEGNQPPLFWCLQRSYELSQLARYLGPNQPVYGMRSGNRVMVSNEVNIQLLARHYVSEIL